MALLIFHVVYALARPHKEPGEKPTTARLAFEIIHIWNGRLIPLLSVVQIIEGMRIIGWMQTIPGLFYFYIAYVAVVLLGILVVEIRFCIKQKGVV
jgi:hypothetical protein